jgi:phosphoribosylformylglycinamidine (FGAM) synthase-like amidotransferase family enzyme
MVISLIRRVNILPRLASSAPFLCLIVAHLEWPDMSPFTRQLNKGEVLRIPIGHMEGNYFCTPEELHRLESEDRIAFRYSTPNGEITPDANPNGSLSNIAGILNPGRNVLGMMPHPDRSSEQLLGSADGWKIFASMVEALATR